MNRWGFVILILSTSTYIHSHTHSHDHDEPHDHSHSHEAPHLKYTREVNEAVIESDQHEHHHDSGEHHEHSHSHSAKDCDHHDNQHDNKRIASTFPKIKVAQHSDDLYASDSFFSFLNDQQTRLWVYAVGSVMLISVFPFFILALIPIQVNTPENSTLLKLLLAFGAGGLLGDAFLHLIPHALPAGSQHSHSHSHEEGHAHEPHDMFVGGWVLTGFMTFFIVEKFMRIMRGDSHVHGHSHKLPEKKKNQKIKKGNESESDEIQTDDDTSPIVITDDSVVVTEIRVAAYLNLVADFMHNFTDGLAIGASFIAGSTIGFVTMVTVLVHEIPHEIGDFAILVQSGYSKKKAMFIQLLTALGALCGCILSLLSVDSASLSDAAEHTWVLPFTAGGFIYIATVSIIPELLEDSKFVQSILEVVAILTGLFMMYLIAWFE